MGAQEAWRYRATLKISPTLREAETMATLREQNSFPSPTPYTLSSFGLLKHHDRRLAWEDG